MVLVHQKIESGTENRKTGSFLKMSSLHLLNQRNSLLLETRLTLLSIPKYDTFSAIIGSQSLVNLCHIFSLRFSLLLTSTTDID